MASLSINQVSLILLPSGAAAILVHGGLAYTKQVVAGLLRSKDDECDRIVVSQIRDAEPDTFTMVFLEIPDGNYTIEIYESPGMLVAWRDVIVDSSTMTQPDVVVKSKSPELRPLPLLTIIKSPNQDGATVSQDPVVGGTATSSGTPTGTMKAQNGSSTVNGVRPTNSNNLWTLEFPNLTPSGPLYDLHVDVPGSGTADRKNLKVQ
jgi:hypothetical protein